MKRKNRRLIALAGLLLCGTFAFSTGYIVASAGMSEGVLVDENSFTGAIINSGSWNIYGNVFAKGSKLRWTEEEGTGEDYLVAKSKIRDNSDWGLKRFLTVDASVNLKSMADGARFAFARGLARKKFFPRRGRLV